MHGEIITIGNELISGRTLDINSQYVAERLTASGLIITRITSTGDDFEMVSEVLMRAIKSSRFVIVTGGLGATEDDITSEIGARALNRPLCLDKRMLDMIKDYVDAKGIELTPSLEKMAWIPEGSRVLHPTGAPCGFRIKEKDAVLYFLPGVPEQMRYLLDRFVLPEIIGLFESLPVSRQRILKLYGLDEPDVAEILKKCQKKTGEIILGFYPHFPENHITISLRGNDESSVSKEIERVEKEIVDLVGPYIFATGNQCMEDVVGQSLLDTGKTIAVAESCTGGFIGHRLTNFPGSSQYLQGGLVVYSNQSKIEWLQVLPETLETYGAVSRRTVKEMALGVKNRMKTDLGLAVTGIAGPGGGTKDKPVGTVYIGLAAGHDIFLDKYRFWGNREQIKLNTSTMALDWIRRYFNGNPFISGI